jgi:integrase/recombinase XerD
MARIRRKKREPKRSAPPLPGSIAAYAEEYYQWLEVHHYSAQTIKNRRSYFAYFLNWCAERGISEPAEVSRSIVERFQKYLYQYRQKRTNEPLSFRTQRTCLLPVRTFFKWLARQGYLLYNPAGEIEMPRVEKRLPKHVLTISEAEAVLAVPDTREPLGVRDRAILETFYSTGMRRMELMNLCLYDLDIERGTVMIRLGKGRKDRMAPIGERAICWIEKYLSEVRPQLAPSPDNGVIFLTTWGDKFNDYSLTELVREYVNKADIGKKGACHLFRHTCATLMLEGGADIRFIQLQLGHADISTTEVYTQVSIRKLKEIHSATHPGAKLQPGSSE